MSLYLWWAAAADMPPDHTIALCWDAMTGNIPPRRAAHPVTGGRPLDPADMHNHLTDAGVEAAAAWWQAQADDAFIAQLKLDKLRLQGVSITSQTAAALRLKVRKMMPLDKVSPDGVRFPTDPADFRAEVLRQARELYAGRAGAGMDTDKLLQPQPRCNPSRDTPDLVSCMQMADPDLLPLAQLDAPPSAAELGSALQSGSDATALDELPRPLLRLLRGHGLNGLLHLLEEHRAGAGCATLDAVIHLPLRKKDPRWLLRNSRPVLLEAFLRRSLARPLCFLPPPESKHGGAPPSTAPDETAAGQERVGACW